MIQFLRQQSMPILLSSAIICTLLSIYTPWLPLITVAVLFYHGLIFRFCDFINHHRPAGAFLYLAGILLLYLIYRLFTPMIGGAFFATMIESDTVPASYFLLLFLIGGYFVASSVYYSTNVRYNSAMLILLIFIPCTLYAAQFKQVPVVYIVLIVVCYFGTMFDHRRRSFSRDATCPAHQFYSRGPAIAALLLMVAIILIPKVSSTPYSLIEWGAQNRNGLATYSNEKMDANGADGPEQTLFNIQIAEPLYLRSTVYDSYDDGHWQATSYRRLSEGTDHWQEMARQLNAAALATLIADAANQQPDFARRYGIDAASLQPVTASAQTAAVENKAFFPAYIPHPDRTYAIYGLEETTLYQNALGEIYATSKRAVSERTNYHILYYQEAGTDALYEALSSTGSLDDYIAFLHDLAAVYEGDGQDGAAATTQYFIAEAAEAAIFTAVNQQAIPDSVSQLAAQIVAGQTSDFDKATALVNYFADHDYTYQANYQPPAKEEGNIAYFLFDSKRGACQDYATAMTLMGRAVGLPIRYVEGFYTGPPGDNGWAAVTNKDAHAYTEVFLPGRGWTVFEPTVAYTSPPGMLAYLATLANHEIMTASLLAALLFLLLALFVKYFLLPPWREVRFRRRLKTRTPLEAIALLYGRIQQLVGNAQQPDTTAYTPQMLATYVRNTYLVDIAPLVACYERGVFGGEALNKTDLDLARHIYFTLYKKLKEYNKREKNRRPTQTAPP